MKSARKNNTPREGLILISGSLLAVVGLLWLWLQAPHPTNLETSALLETTPAPEPPSPKPDTNETHTLRDHAITTHEKPRWISPEYSVTEYDPGKATDPEYRKRVNQHLFLESFCSSPLRLRKAFEEVVSLFEQWEIDPEENLRLCVPVHNMAFQYHMYQDIFRRQTGIMATEADKRFEEGYRARHIQNIKERFHFLLGEFPKAKFEEVLAIQPTAQFPDYAMKIEPGTLLISK